MYPLISTEREAKMVKTTIRIDGMMCGMCEAHMNDAIRRVVPDAKKVKSSHTDIHLYP